MTFPEGRRNFVVFNSLLATALLFSPLKLFLEAPAVAVAREDDAVHRALEWMFAGLDSDDPAVVATAVDMLHATAQGAETPRLRWIVRKALARMTDPGRPRVDRLGWLLGNLAFRLRERRHRDLQTRVIVALFNDFDRAARSGDRWVSHGLAMNIPRLRRRPLRAFVARLARKLDAADPAVQAYARTTLGLLVEQMRLDVQAAAGRRGGREAFQREYDLSERGAVMRVVRERLPDLRPFRSMESHGIAP